MFDHGTRAQLRSQDPGRASIRWTSVDETGALAAVAARDSQRLPDGPWLVAELDGTALAVLSLPTGSFVADPFSHSVGLRRQLELRAAQLGDAPDRRRRVLRRRSLRALRA